MLCPPLSVSQARRKGSKQTMTETIPPRKTSVLLRQADQMLRRARCDTVTGERKDHSYKLRKRAERKQARRLTKRKEREFGKLDAASPVRRIEPGDANGEGVVGLVSVEGNGVRRNAGKVENAAGCVIDSAKGPPR
jgi:hypothetical protein